MAELAGTGLFNDAALVAYYKLENVNDATAGARTLTNNNTATFVSGIYNNGVKLTGGTNQSLSRADTMGIVWGAAMTICGWVKLNNEITTSTWILFNLDHEVAGGTTSVFRYEFNSGIRRLKYVRYNSALVDDEPYHVVTMGTTAWHHCAITYTGSVMSIYYDAVLVATQSSTNTAGTGSTYTQQFGIGTDLNATSTDAMFDDVAVFSRALSWSDIKMLYDNANLHPVFQSGGTRPHPFSPGIAR